MKKKLFLDIDGVLNTNEFLRDAIHSLRYGNYQVLLMPEKIRMLNRLLDSLSKVEVIFHSNWFRAIGAKATTKALKKAGFSHNVIFTPKKLSSEKVHEIQFSLMGDETHIAIIDDEDIGFDFFRREHSQTLVIQTNPEEGLTDDQIKDLKVYFESTIP